MNVDFGSDSSSSSTTKPIAIIASKPTISEHKKFETALTNYYRLKKRYEESLETMKKPLLENKNLSLIEKRNRMVKKCINCGREGGGTIFSIETVHNSDPLFTYRILSAECGSSKEKCNLNIKLNVGRFSLLPQIIEDLKKEQNINETNIIKLKNQSKFGYITEEEAATTPLIDDENSIGGNLKYFLETKKKINESDDVIKSKEQEKEISIWLESFKKQIKTPLDLETFMRDYKENYFDKKQEIMKIKYKNSGVNIDENKNLHLDHVDVPINNLDFVYMVEQQIISDIFDNSSSKPNKKNKTRKTGKKNNPNNKTKKVIVEERKNPYKILGIDNKDDLTKIKIAYRKLVLKFHPDKFLVDEKNPMTKEEAMDKFKDVSNAYENLADPEKRAYYDRNGVYDTNIHLSSGTESNSSGGGGGGGNMNPFTLYNMFFNQTSF
jgi:hypothetical protein